MNQETSMNAIRRVLWRGGRWSKRQLAEATGLSLATCNLALNELSDAGEAYGIKYSNGHVGRNSLLYSANEARGLVLCLRAEMAVGAWRVTCDLLTVLGSVVYHDERRWDSVTPLAVANLLGEVISQRSGIEQVSLGVPGNVAGARIEHCDAPELNGGELFGRLEALGVPALVTNDAHAMAFGYWRELGERDKVVTLALFPEGVMPGMATVYKGRVLTGANAFAGMMGFAPLGDETAGKRDVWVGEHGRELAARALASIAAAVNPDVILCSGSLIDKAAVESIGASVARWIPEGHVPQLLYRDDLGDVYLSGLLGRALEARLGEEGGGEVERRRAGALAGKATACAATASGDAPAAAAVDHASAAPTDVSGIRLGVR